jgi:hypothetical protein
MSYYIPVWADCTAFGDEKRKQIIIEYKLVVVVEPQPPKNGRSITISQPAEETKDAQAQS